MYLKISLLFSILTQLYSFNHSICMAKRFDSDTAKVKIQKILDVEPKNVQCLLQLANIYLKNGKIGIGFEILIEAYDIDPNIVKNSEIAKILPFALRVTELKHKANNTNNPKYWNRLADGYFNLGIMSEAIVSYKKSLKADPKQIEIRLKLSIAYKKIGQIYNSLDQIKEALRIDDKNFYANYYMAKIMKERFKDKKAYNPYFKRAYEILIEEKKRFKQKEYNRLLDDIVSAMQIDNF